MGYLKTTFRGISWMAALRVVTRGLTIVKIAILARILLPAQFGIYGIATLVLGLLEMLTETGINVFLIQEKDDVDGYINSAWVTSIIKGIIISAIILITIPFITMFFATPNARDILYLISVVPFIRGFINPSIVKFQKNLEFNKQFFYSTSLFLIDIVVGVSLGILTHSENSLIWGMIVAALVEVFISFLVIKPTPKFSFEKEKLMKVINRGKWVTGAGIFNYLFLNLDDILVGRILGTTSLGVYQQAYKISSLPVTEVGEVFNRVTFPVYSTIGEDHERLKKAFLKTLSIITILVVPFGILVFLFPDLIVRLLLGQGWESAIPVLKVLAIFGICKAISNSFFSLFLALKKQEVVMLITFVGIFVMAVTIFPLVNKFGLIGAGLSTIIATLVSLPFTIFHYRKIFAIKV